MQDVMTELAAALRERLAIVGDEESRREPSGHMERLRKISDRIVELTEQLPLPVDAQLKHYLDRCSYSKALEFLEANSA